MLLKLEKGAAMPSTPNSPSRQIKKSDVLSSAAVSGFLTFFLLTLSKEIEPNHWMLPYLTDHSISFLSGIVTAVVAFGLSLARFEISLMIQERDYKRKIYYLDKLIAKTTDEQTLSKLNTLRNSLIVKSAKKIASEEI